MIYDGITIDGESSKDLDDAFWIESTSDGFELSVLISHVSLKVAIESPEDIRASKLQFSIYRGAGGCVKPMLPRKLSEDALSLNLGVERNVVRFTLHLDRALNCTRIQISEDIFLNRHRLTPNDANEILSDQDHALNRPLQLLETVSRRLLEKRRDAGAMAIYDIIAGWGTNEEGHLRELSDSECNIGYIIVQELMILTNSTLSSYCVEHDIPILYRNHQPKSAAPPVEDFSRELQKGVSAGDRQYLKLLKGRISLVAGKAEMGVSAKGHYGLNLPAYAYFTSPIRRYPDLICHRNLLAHVKGEQYPYSQEQLEVLAQRYNERQQVFQDERSEFFRSQANHDGKSNLRANRFRALSEAELYRVLKIIERDDISLPLQDEVCLRMEAGSLDRKTASLVFSSTGKLFDHPYRERLVTCLQKEPHAATMIYNIIQQKYEGSALELDQHASGPDNQRIFSCQASAIVSSRQLQSKVIQSTTKKKAAQFATLDILQQLLDVSLDISEPGEVPVVQAEIAQSFELTLEEGVNPKVVLQEWCQKLGVEAPSYKTSNSGPPHSPTFITEIYVSVNSERVSATGEAATNKKESERLAAFAWITNFSARER